MKEKINILTHHLVVLTLFVMLTNSCKKDDPVIELKLGMNYQGGIIFHLDATGKHGFIAPTSDQSNTAQWINGSYLTSLLTSTGASSIDDGSSNTSLIIKTFGNTGSYSAKICRDYKGGGFNDWYLPSKNELNILYTQKSLVGGFADEIYWSSSEYDAGSAWVQYFLNGEQHLDNTSDAANVHTRAIRSF